MIEAGTASPMALRRPGGRGRRHRRADLPAPDGCPRLDAPRFDSPPVETHASGVQRAGRILSAANARWPMYLRNVKQILRQAEGGFDERRYGFGGLIDLLKACQRDGLVRIERDHRGGLRVFQGHALRSVYEPTKVTAPVPDEAAEVVEATPVDTAPADAVAVDGIGRRRRPRARTSTRAADLATSACPSRSTPRRTASAVPSLESRGSGPCVRCRSRRFVPPAAALQRRAPRRRPHRRASPAEAARPPRATPTASPGPRVASRGSRTVAPNARSSNGGTR